MKKLTPLIILAVVALGALYTVSAKRLNNISSPVGEEEQTSSMGVELAAQFEVLNNSANTSCSGSFTDSIADMPDTERLRGSCCSPMSKHRYGEQIEGLKKYAHIPEIPPDPYDVEVGLANKLMAQYDADLTPEQQQAYDYAMSHSDEKGPCCCKCWRWYVYGGLGKILIRDYGFSGKQVVEVWNLSNGCGGDADHLHS